MMDHASAKLPTGSKRKRGRPSDDERHDIDQRVIEAAFVIFEAQGFDSARMDKLAAAAGITKMSLYRRFPGKAELLAAVIRRHSFQLLNEIPVPESDSDPIADIKALMWSYRKRIGDSNILGLQRLALTAVHEDSVRQAVADVHARYVKPVDALIEKAKLNGALPLLPTAEIREILFDLLVNDAASLPLHSFHLVDDPLTDDQRRIFLQRWSVFEGGLLRSGMAAYVGSDVSGNE